VGIAGIHASEPRDAALIKSLRTLVSSLRRFSEGIRYGLTNDLKIEVREVYLFAYAHTQASWDIVEFLYGEHFCIEPRDRNLLRLADGKTNLMAYTWDRERSEFLFRQRLGLSQAQVEN